MYMVQLSKYINISIVNNNNFNNDRSVTFDHKAGSHQTPSKSQCCIDLVKIVDQSKDKIIEIVTNCNCI